MKLILSILACLLLVGGVARAEDNDFEPAERPMTRPAVQQPSAPRQPETPSFTRENPPPGYAKPTGAPWEKNPSAVTENGVAYTGKSCKRRDGSIGREGRGPQGQLGCWAF